MNRLLLNDYLKEALALMIKKSDLGVSRLRHEINHSLNILEWLFVLKSDSPLSLQLAALMHDVDRFFDQRRARKGLSETYQEYKSNHQNYSANIASELLAELGLNDHIEEVKSLIKVHEVGGNELAEILKNADSLSFFDKNIIEYYKDKGLEKTVNKVNYMYQRMSESAKDILRKKDFDFKSIEFLNKLIKY